MDARRGSLVAAVAVWIFGFSCVADAAPPNPNSDFQHQWPQWRGPSVDGVAPHANPPLKWDSKQGVRWKVDLPGEGSATPIIWHDQVFVLAAVPTERLADKPAEPHPEAKTTPPKNLYEFVVISLDRETGRERWRQIACEAAPHEGRHTTNTYASGSPATDGKRLYVSFGSRGLFCYDLDGNLQWKRQFGNLRTRNGWGEGTSPAVHGDQLVIVCDQEENSFLEVLDAKTGETRWRAKRDEPTTWATPLIVTHEDRTQLVVNGTRRVRGYDWKSGEVLWECGGQTVNAIPSPLANDGVVYCMSGYRGAAAYAIPLDARGDVTDSPRIRWSHREATPYVPSPILVGDQIYFTRENSSLLTSLHISDGKPLFGPVRLPGLSNLYASPVSAAGRIYFVDRNGTTVVLNHGPKLEVLATNRLDEPIDASPALVGNQMFLRAASRLYCLANE